MDGSVNCHAPPYDSWPITPTYLLHLLVGARRIASWNMIQPGNSALDIYMFPDYTLHSNCMV